MKPYVVLLSALVALLVGSMMLTGTLHSWRTGPSVPPQGSLVDQLLDTPIPADPLDVVYVADALAELGLQEAGKLRKYLSFRVIAQELSDPPEVVPKVRDAVRWISESDKTADKVFLDVMAKALSLQLAPADTPSPKVEPRGYSRETVVITASNQLHVPIEQFRYYMAIKDKAGKQPDLLAKTTITCIAGSIRSTALVPGQQAQLACDVFVPPSSSGPPNEFRDILAEIRAGNLLLEAVPESLKMPMVSLRAIGADSNHQATGVESMLWAKDQSERGRKLVKSSSCRQRGDCEQQIKRKVAEYGGFAELAIFVCIGLLPGAIVAGIIRSLPGGRKTAIAVLAVISFLAFPIAWNNGGSGFGPLAAVLLLAYVIAGGWVGFALGSAVLPRRQDQV